MLAKLLKNTQANHLIILSLALVFINYVAPHLPLPGISSLSNTPLRHSLSIILITAYSIKIIAQWIYQYRLESWSKLCDYGKQLDCQRKCLWAKITDHSKQQKQYWQSRWSQDQHRRLFKRTPCYLVYGLANSGKSSLLQCCGLRQVKPETYGAQCINALKQFNIVGWHFTEQAIFADISQLNIESLDATDKTFFKFLRKQSKAKPLSGMILTFNAQELVLMAHDDRKLLLAQIGDTINNLYKQLYTPIPIYIMVTKCDLIAGFSEFFSDLSKEELSQVWGVTFPLQENINAQLFGKQFNYEFNQLIARLQQRVLWSLDIEKNLHNRHLIYIFPQQIQCLKIVIQLLIQDLFASITAQEIIQCRGVYLTSAKQQGETYDFFMHMVNKDYPLTSNLRVKQEPHNETYFVSQLFAEVLLPESKVLGFSERAKRLKNIFYRSFCLSLPVFVISAAMCLHHSYINNRHLTQQIRDDLTQYKLATDALAPNDLSILHTLPALNALHLSEKRLNNSSWSSYLLLTNLLLKKQITQALDRNLHSLFLPRIAAGLEADLETDKLSINNLYADLKGYLAFSPSHFTLPKAILAPMEIKWGHLFSKQPHLQQRLRYYLHRASHLPLDKLPLNRPLINKVRQQLQQVIPARRAYALLTIEALASDINGINFATVMGRQFTQYFHHHGNNLYIPSLYTKAGFKQIFQPSYQTITQQVANDNREIGLNINANMTQSYQAIITAMQQQYQQKYLNAWQNFLHNTSMTQINSMTEAAKVYTELGSEHSALKKLLALIYTNTHDINSEDVNVAKHYQPLNQFSRRSLTASKLDKALDLIHKLGIYFNQLANSRDRNQAALNAATDYMKRSGR